MLIRKPRPFFLRKARDLFFLIYNPVKFSLGKIIEPKGDCSKVVIINKENKILLLKIGYGHRSWVLPGGSVDRGETPLDSAKRELKEESGIEVDSLNFITTRKHDTFEKVRIHYFYGTTQDSKITIDCQEIVDGGWFECDKLPDPRRVKLDREVKLFLDWRQGL